MSVNDAEAGREIWFVNRSVVILHPKGPFVRWVIKAEPEDAPAKETVESASTAFLIPDFEREGEAHAWLQENCSVPFELMLADWFTSEERWPADRDWPVFREWFKIEYIDIAWDLVDAPLSSDPPERIEDTGENP